MPLDFKGLTAFRQEVWKTTSAAHNIASLSTAFNDN